LAPPPSPALPLLERGAPAPDYFPAIILAEAGIAPPSESHQNRRMLSRARPFQFEQGAVHFPELGLWLDAHRSRSAEEWVVITHAHADHIARHKRVILTEPTARLLRQRLGGRREERILRFGERIELRGPQGAFALTLLPAGHILGSAMALVEWTGGTLLYTGDFRLRPSPACEPCEFAAATGCDWLVMETTFGRPEYVFPPIEQVVSELLNFCHGTLAEGATPVLLGWTLGKAQELLCHLADSGIRVLVHPNIHPLARVYRRSGIRMAPFEPLRVNRLRREPQPPRCVLVCPPSFPRSPERAALGPCRFALATGWALDAGCRYRNGVDAAFPLSDHADFPELVQFVRQVRPRCTFTTHGFAADFAASLRDLGFAAEALVAEEQLTFPLGVAPQSSRPA